MPGGIVGKTGGNQLSVTYFHGRFAGCNTVMNAQQFLEGALEFARNQQIMFDGYDAQYQILHCYFLPLYNGQATIGIVSLDQNGNYRYTRLAASSEERGAPRNC